MTTVRELYEWAVENHAEDLPIGLLYQDDDKALNGDTFAEEDMRDLGIDVCNRGGGPPRRGGAEYILLS